MKTIKTLNAAIYGLLSILLIALSFYNHVTTYDSSVNDFSLGGGLFWLMMLLSPFFFTSYLSIRSLDTLVNDKPQSTGSIVTDFVLTGLICFSSYIALVDSISSFVEVMGYIWIVVFILLALGILGKLNEGGASTISQRDTYSNDNYNDKETFLEGSKKSFNFMTGHGKTYRHTTCGQTIANSFFFKQTCSNPNCPAPHDGKWLRVEL